MEANCKRKLSKMLSPPVLFLIFNRPDLTAQSFSQIREAKPLQLFIAADGARPGVAGEKAACEEARKVSAAVDWECDVKTLFHSENQGCAKAVSTAISWFFEHVESGIILEDDCVAHPSFFVFCRTLLERYKDDNRIMCITGNNFQRGIKRGNASYYFSMFPHCWGWASWRRAWGLYNPKMENLSQIVQTGLLTNLVGAGDEGWLGTFKQVENGTVDSWAYRWLLSCWSQHGLTVTPNRNLVTNVGFDERATHTRSITKSSNMQSYDIGDIVHPLFVQRCCVADDFVLSEVFGRPYTATKNKPMFKLKKAAAGMLRSFGVLKTKPA